MKKSILKSILKIYIFGIIAVIASHRNIVTLAKSEQNYYPSGIQTEGGAESNKQGLQDYGTWLSTNGRETGMEPYSYAGYTMRSFLLDNGDGSLTRIEELPAYRDLDTVIPSSLVLEKYNSDFQFIESIELNYPEGMHILGGAYSGDQYNYVVYGGINAEKNTEQSVMRVIKYDKQWAQLGFCDIAGTNTIIPFDGGSLRMAEYKNTLYIHTSHQMFDRHQANMTIVVDSSTMKLLDVMDTVGSAATYASHSLNQFVKIDGNDLIFLDHSDGYPSRGAILHVYPNAANNMAVPQIGNRTTLVSFPGERGTNNTRASIGGLEYSTSSYLVAGSQINNSANVPNIFVSITSKEDVSNTKVIYLTNYGSDGSKQYACRTPQLVKINDERFMLLWEELEYLDIDWAEHSAWEVENRLNGMGYDVTVHYVILDQNGNPITEEHKVRTHLSDCQPIVYRDYVVWYYTGYISNKWASSVRKTPPVFCAIPTDGSAVEDPELKYTTIKLCVKEGWGSGFYTSGSRIQINAYTGYQEDEDPKYIDELEFAFWWIEKGDVSIEGNTYDRNTYIRLPKSGEVEIRALYKNDTLQNGWYGSGEWNNRKYRFYLDNVMLTGWQEINGDTYYFYDDGILATDTWIDGRYVDKEGVWKEQLSLLGDINNDGKVDAKDRMYLARYLAGWDGYTLLDEKVADVNGDSKVDAKDRMYLARYLAGWDGYSLKSTGN